MNRPRLSLLSFALAISLFAAPGGAVEFERVLLPIILNSEVPGAFGSRWTSDFLVRNDNDETVIVTPGLSPCPIECATGVVSPHVSFRPEVSLRFPYPGAFLFVSRPGNARVSFNLRVLDLSRQALAWGTEIPVVREKDVRTDAITLLNVPTDSRFRTMLRVYDFDGAADDQVRVRIYAANDQAVLADSIVTLRSPSGLPEAIPGYAQIGNLTDTYPQLLSADRLRIEITPVTPGVRFWAFVSVTNNDTQHVTTITPQ